MSHSYSAVRAFGDEWRICVKLGSCGYPWVIWSPVHGVKNTPDTESVILKTKYSWITHVCWTSVSRKVVVLCDLRLHVLLSCLPFIILYYPLSYSRLSVLFSTHIRGTIASILSLAPRNCCISCPLLIISTLYIYHQASVFLYILIIQHFSSETCQLVAFIRT